MLTTRKRLGLAVTEQGILAVEVAVTGPRRTILHTAEIVFSDDLNLSRPDNLGKELRAVLRRNGMSASRCTVGLAAAALAAKEKSLPATDAESLRGALVIAAEREFASGPGELAFDFSRVRTAAGLSALLVAAPRKLLDQLQAMAQAAGLAITGVTSSVVALAMATKSPVPAEGRLVLCLQPRGVEITVQAADGVRMVRYLPARLDQPDVEIDGLAGQLRMILSMVPTDSGGQDRQMILWDSAGLDRSSVDSLAKRLGVSLVRCSLAGDLEATDCESGVAGNQFAPAAALVCGAERLAIDFIHSRLAEARKSRLGLRTKLFGAAAAAVLAAGVLLFIAWSSTQSDIRKLQTELSGKQADSRKATLMVNDVKLAGGWYERRPPFMDCLAEIALSMPDHDIWATNVNVAVHDTTPPTGHVTLQATVTGKARDQATALELINRMKNDRKFVDVTPLYTRQVGGASKDVSFAISLTLPEGKQ